MTRLLPEMIAAQAETSPDAIAVAQGGQLVQLPAIWSIARRAWHEAARRRSGSRDPSGHLRPEPMSHWTRPILIGGCSAS